MGTSHRPKRTDSLYLAVDTPLSREAAACAGDLARPRRDLYRLLQQETIFLRTDGPSAGGAGSQSGEHEVGFVSLHTPEGGEYLPIFDHPNKLKAAARQMGVEGRIHYIEMKGEDFWELHHATAVVGVLLNPGRQGTILVGRFDMDILAAGICPGDLELAIAEGAPVEHLLQQHPLLVPCTADGTAEVFSGSDGARLIYAFSSTDAFTAYLSHGRPTHIVCKPGAVCIEEAAQNGCLLMLNPDGPATCSLNPLVVAGRFQYD